MIKSSFFVEYIKHYKCTKRIKVQLEEFIKKVYLTQFKIV